MDDDNAGAWERVNKIFAAAYVIEELTRLYREGGHTRGEARAKAAETWRAAHPGPGGPCE